MNHLYNLKKRTIKSTALLVVLLFAFTFVLSAQQQQAYEKKEAPAVIAKDKKFVENIKGPLEKDPPLLLTSAQSENSGVLIKTEDTKKTETVIPTGDPTELEHTTITADDQKLKANSKSSIQGNVVVIKRADFDSMPEEKKKMIQAQPGLYMIVE